MRRLHAAPALPPAVRRSTALVPPIAPTPIAADFGYGARGAGGVIPPNADLIFEVELLAIN